MKVINGPRALPAAVFQALLRMAGERVSLDSPGFKDALREEAALLGWVQMDEKDPKSWIQVLWT